MQQQINTDNLLNRFKAQAPYFLGFLTGAIICRLPVDPSAHLAIAATPLFLPHLCKDLIDTQSADNFSVGVSCGYLSQLPYFYKQCNSDDFSEATQNDISF